MKIIIRRFNLRVWSFFLIILFFIFKCTDSTQKENIAIIGNLYISTYEFKNIAQFNPYLSTIKNIDSTKKYVLSTLIAEKILVLEANKIKDFNQGKLKKVFEQYEREAIIEKFWQDEIFDKINISEKELTDAYFKSKEKRIIKFLQFDDTESALRVRKYLENEKSFNDLDDYLKNNITIDTIEYIGKLPSIEDSVFSMTKTDKIKFIKEGKKYFLVELQNIKRNIFTSEDDFDMTKKKLSKILKQKKSIQNYDIYQKKYFKPFLYNLDKMIFKEVVQKMDEQLFENKIKQTFDNENIPNLIDSKSFETLSEKSIVKFNDDDNWTVKDLISRMSVSPYPVDFNNRGKFRISMIAATKHILDDEVIVKHSLNLGLDNTDYVEKETQMWKDYIIAEKMIKHIILKNSLSINDKKSLSLKKIDEFLIDKLPDYNIKINYDILDTLKLYRTDMVVFKTHFPERTIAPLLQLLPDLNSFNNEIFGERRENNYPEN